MTPRLFPLGIQTFEKVREENRVYIDKTEDIYRMTHMRHHMFSSAVRAVLESHCLCRP